MMVKRCSAFALVAVMAVTWLACGTGTVRSGGERVSGALAGRALPGYIRGSRSSHAPRVIVFVHGIFGSGDSTWRNSNGTYFPDLVAQDPTFAGTDIWVHDFPSATLRRSYSIDELSENLRAYLEDDNVITNHDQIIFVGHSMGGLVIRSYLLKYRLPATRVPMLYLYSTPTTGSYLANVGSLVSKNPELADMRKMSTDRSTVLDTLQSSWESSEYVRQTRTHCAYEKLRTGGFFVVAKESATNMCNAPLDPILANHIDISKPADERSPSYVAFRNAYRRTLSSDRTERRAAWNLTTRGDYDTFSVSNYTLNDGRRDAWSNHTTAAPGDYVAFNIHYRNDSDSAAHDAHCRIEIPSEARGGDIDITASVWSDDTATAHGRVRVSVLGGIPVVLVPELGADWYPNAAGSPAALPYDQAASAIVAPQGLRLGDVQAGWEFRSDVVVRFRCVPASVLVIKNGLRKLFEVQDELKKMTNASDALERLRQVLPKADEFLERPIMSESPRWSAAARDLRANDDLLVYATLYNSGTAAARDVRVTMRRDESAANDYRVAFKSGDRMLQMNVVHLYFVGDGLKASFVVSAAIRPVWFNEAMRPSSVDVPGGDDESGLVLGDVAPRSSVLVMLGYEVVGVKGQALPQFMRDELVRKLRAQFKEAGPCMTRLDGGGDNEAIVVIADQRDNQWHAKLENTKAGEKIAVRVAYRNGGDCPAIGATAAVTLEPSGSEIKVRASLAAENAVRRDAETVFTVAGERKPVQLQLNESRWFWGDALYGAPLDIRSGARVPLGDLLPGDSGSVVLYYATSR